VILLTLLVAVFPFLALGFLRNPVSARRLAELSWEDLLTRRAVVGIGLGMTCGYGKGRVPSYVNEAASAYYLMRLRLLALYEASHAARYPSLASAL
jgi:hypothetical protein